MRLTWNQIGEKLYETGVDKGVVYPIQPDNTYSKGYAWNGLSAVTESPSGGEPTDVYADNIKYLSLMSVETLNGTIEAYMSPEEFDECDGTAEIADGVYIGQQDRKSFGFCYRTKIGNDAVGDNYGYKLHLIYGAKASPSERNYTTTNDSPEAMTLSWEFNTTPVEVAGKKSTSRVIIDSTRVTPENLKKIEDILYGTESLEPRLPLPDEIIEILSSGDQPENDNEI